MTGDQAASAIAGLLCLTLVASSLIARRLAWRQTIKLALAWALIFAVIFFVASFFVPREPGNWVAAKPRPGLDPMQTLHNVDYRAI